MSPLQNFVADFLLILIWIHQHKYAFMESDLLDGVNAAQQGLCCQTPAKLGRVTISLSKLKSLS